MPPRCWRGRPGPSVVGGSGVIAASGAGATSAGSSAALAARRRELPLSSSREALWTRRSKIASASVGDRRLAQSLVPVTDRQLARHDGRAEAPAIVDHLQQVGARAGGTGCSPRSSRTRTSTFAQAAMSRGRRPSARASTSSSSRRGTRTGRARCDPGGWRRGRARRRGTSCPPRSVRSRARCDGRSPSGPRRGPGRSPGRAPVGRAGQGPR
jgi:hypothetical protein